MGQISKEGAGCFWTFWGLAGIGAGIQVIYEEGALIVGLLIIAGSIFFIKYAGRAIWKGFQPFNKNKKGTETLNQDQKADAQYSIIINPQTEISLNRELKTQLEAGEITIDKAEDIKANFKAQQSAAYSIQNQSLSGQKRIKAIYLLAEKNKQVSQNPVGDSNKSIDGNIEKLEKFKSLLDAGVLTQEEFDKMKKSILEKM